MTSLKNGVGNENQVVIYLIFIKKISLSQDQSRRYLLRFSNFIKKVNHEGNTYQKNL